MNLFHKSNHQSPSPAGEGWGGVFLFLLLFFCLTAGAEDVTLTKCRGVVGRQGWGDKRCPNVSVATQFTAAETAQCAGGMLSSVRCYIANTANLGTFEVWVKGQYDDETKLASQVIAEPRVGWNEVTLDTPVPMTTKMPIALGYTYTAVSGTAKPVAFADVVSPGGIYLNLGGGYIDGTANPSIYANLCIEGTVTGLDLDYAMKVTSLSLDSTFYAPGKNVVATIGYHNTGRAVSSVKLTLTSGNITRTKTITENLINDQARTTTITFPAPDEVNGCNRVSVAVTELDGQPYDGRALTAKYGTVKWQYDRNVVLEEITGTWCGWCIRGFVGMEEMHKKYPDTFIGIAVHYNDAMQVDEYWQSIGYSSAPCCDVDRHPSMAALGVTPGNMEIAHNKERARRTYADFDFNAVKDGGKVVARTSATFDFDAEEIDMRMVYALIEDGVTGYPQKNYYAGGGNGPMGGYENKPSVITDMVFDEVARGIYPSYAGVKGSLAASVVKGQTYTHSQTFDIPKNVKDANRLSLVAMLLDGTSGQIVQAHKVHLIDGDGIATASPTTDTPNRWYTTDGRALPTPPTNPGLYIHNGRKVIVK